MKQSLTYTILLLLTIIAVVGCSGVKQTANDTSAVDSTFIYRDRLTVEQQREYDKVYLEAINQKLKGNRDAAYELFSYALTINPNAAETLYELSQLDLYDSSGLKVFTGDQAIASWAQLERAVALEPSNPYYRAALAIQYINNGQFDEAIPLYKKMVEEKPDEQNITLLSRLYETTGDTDNAIKTLEHLEQQMGYTDEIAVGMYRIYVNSGHHDKAIKCIERLVEENPDELRYQVMLGDVYMAEKRVDEAKTIYNTVLLRDPQNTFAKSSMLQYYLQQEDTESFNSNLSDILLDPKVDNVQKRGLLQSYASELLHGAKGLDKETFYNHFLEALSLPQEDTSLAEMCIAYIGVAKLPDSHAIPVYEAILRDHPDDVQARLMMLQQSVITQNMDQLIAVCHEGTVQHPEELIFYYYEGMGLYQQNRTKEAVSVYEQGVAAITEESDTDMASDIYATLGDIYHADGQIEKAYQAYESALDIKADNVGCLNNYAYFLALEGKDLDKALEMSKKAIDAEPNNPTYLDTFAWALYCKKQYTQARIYIDQTIKNIPEEEAESAVSASLYDHAGDIYFRCGEKDAALDFWKHAQSLSDDQELTKKLNLKLKNKRL